MKRLSSLKENNNANASKTMVKSAGVIEFDLSGMKVIVKLKSNVELKAESASSLSRIAGTGGLVALNSLRNSGGFDQRC